MSTYIMAGLDRDLPYDQADGATLVGYNAGINQVAEESDVLYADVFAAQAMALWMIDPDGVHADKLSHRGIANRIFEVLAQNCSGLSRKAFAAQRNFPAPA